MNQETEQTYVSGFTWRSYLAALYAIVVFQPAYIWIFLMTVAGRQIGWAVTWFAVILWVEILRLTGGKLTKQEATCIYCASLTSVLNAGVAIGSLYALYFVNSPIIASFGLGTLPTWYAPAPETGLFWLRDYIHPAWVLPLAIMVLNSFIGGVTWMSMGMFAREIFIESENLPFPMEVVTAGSIETLTERETEKLSVFSICAAGGFIYGLFLYTFPLVGQALGYLVELIPAPWLDLNYYVQWFLPGASFGVCTDLLFISLGLVLPLNVVVSMFIGSFGLYFVGNWISVTYRLYTAPWWAPGSKIGEALQRSTLYLWANPVIGASIAVGVMPLLLRPRSVIAVFRFRGASSRQGLAYVRLFFMTFLAGAAVNIAVVKWLVPDFPIWWLLIMVIAFSIVNTLTTTRIYGITGQRTEMPLRNISILASGYLKPDIWVAPVEIADGAGWAGFYKIGKITQTTTESINKIFWAAWPITILMSFLYVRAFWRMAPIPSAAYPGVEIFWPVTATYQCLWITRAENLFQPLHIVAGFAVTCVLHLVQNFLPLPLSIGGLIAGCLMAIPYSVTLLAGSLASFILVKYLGREWFGRNRQVLAAGLAMGEGIAVVIGCSIALIIKSTWVMPF